MYLFSIIFPKGITNNITVAEDTQSSMKLVNNLETKG